MMYIPSPRLVVLGYGISQAIKSHLQNQSIPGRIVDAQSAQISEEHVREGSTHDV